MKAVLLILFSVVGLSVFGQQPVKPIAVPDSTKKIQVVETACGQCKFGLKEKGCLLAVRINGQAYFVDGTSIDEHGDAHADDGFCNAVRKAEVQGTVVKGRFQATYFKLLPGTVARKEEH